MKMSVRPGHKRSLIQEQQNKTIFESIKCSSCFKMNWIVWWFFLVPVAMLPVWPVKGNFTMFKLSRSSSVSLSQWSVRDVHLVVGGTYFETLSLRLLNFGAAASMGNIPQIVMSVSYFYPEKNWVCHKKKKVAELGSAMQELSFDSV